MAFSQAGERTPAAPVPVDVSVLGDTLVVRLDDGTVLRQPVADFPRLARANDAERARWQLCAGGAGIHWPLIDEDLSVAGLLRTATRTTAR
ncbi:MAG: DUF2442 domain-containing protein [Azospirillaceae bacterium]